MDQLDQAAELFKEHDHIQGGFGHVSKKVLVSWANTENLRCLVDDLGKVTAAASVHVVSYPKKVLDFAGSHVATMLPGDISMNRVAFKPGYVGDLALLINEKVKSSNPTSAIWIEDFIEHAPTIKMGLAIDRICTKIKADSTMMGVWCNKPRGRINAKTWSGDEVTLEKLDLDIKPAAVNDVQYALRDKGVEWADHYSHYNVKNTWAALTLRGYGGREDFIIKPSEMSKKWRSENKEKLDWQIKDTPARERFPEAEPLIDAVPGKKHRVRFMRLEAGSELLRHADITDPEAGMLQGQLLRIHIPIVTNKDCIVTQWELDGQKKERHMGRCEAWYLDTRKPHAVRNEGESDRIHLVMDVESNRKLRQMLGVKEPKNKLEKWI